MVFPAPWINHATGPYIAQPQTTTRWLRRNRRHTARIQQQDERCWKCIAWREEETWNVMAHFPNKPSTWASASLLSRQLFSLTPFVSYRFEIYLWPLLWKKSHIKTTIWVVTEEQLRRCQPYRKVEETRLRKSMSSLYWSFWSVMLLQFVHSI